MQTLDVNKQISPESVTILGNASPARAERAGLPRWSNSVSLSDSGRHGILAVFATVLQVLHGNHGATGSPGDTVQLACNPFSGLKALVTRVLPHRQRVIVLMDFLGRQTTVELPCSAVTLPAEERLRLLSR